MISINKNINENYFLQGMISGKDGLTVENCPYELGTSSFETDSKNIFARIDWLEGWGFGKFVILQRLRAAKSQEIKNALRTIFFHENAYCEMIEIVNHGVFKSGFKYFSAKRKSDQLVTNIIKTKEFCLLKDLHIELYFPWRSSEAPYTFKIYDRQLDLIGKDERIFRRLLSKYGDLHGVRAAWHEYVHTDFLESMIPKNLD